jgi:short-subunit dehydrogenase
VAKNAIITGASSGIGLALAMAFAEEGARLVVAALPGADLDQAEALLRKSGAAAVVRAADLTRPGACEDLARLAVSAYGGIDVLINNAGIGLHAPIADAAAEDVRALFQLNVLVPAAMIHAVLPVMRRQARGLVVNVASVSARLPFPDTGHYGASKAALTRISDVLRIEESHRGISVLTVFPGLTRTGFHLHQLGLRGKEGHAWLRPVPPEKVARAVVRGIHRDRRSVYVSWFPDRWGVLMQSLSPRLVSAFLSWMSRRAASEHPAGVEYPVEGQAEQQHGEDHHADKGRGPARGSHAGREFLKRSRAVEPERPDGKRGHGQGSQQDPQQGRWADEGGHDVDRREQERDRAGAGQQPGPPAQMIDQ